MPKSCRPRSAKIRQLLESSKPLPAEKRRSARATMATTAAGGVMARTSRGINTVLSFSRQEYNKQKGLESVAKDSQLCDSKQNSLEAQSDGENTESQCKGLLEPPRDTATESDLLSRPLPRPSLDIIAELVPEPPQLLNICGFSTAFNTIDEEPSVFTAQTSLSWTGLGAVLPLDDEDSIDSFQFDIMDQTMPPALFNEDKSYEGWGSKSQYSLLDDAPSAKFLKRAELSPVPAGQGPSMRTVNDMNFATNLLFFQNASIIFPTTAEQGARNTGRWTDEEDAMLKNAVSEQSGPPYSWKIISSKYFQGTRNANQCKGRWTKKLSPGINRGPYTAEDDALIFKMRKDGASYVAISKMFPDRTADQIRERFTVWLDKSRKKDIPWTDEEKRVLAEAQKQMGNKWLAISKLLPGRSNSDVKNQWYKTRMSSRRALKRELAKLKSNASNQN